jgi:hypothetical protein
MAQMVPREHYANSSTWNSTVWHIAAVTGPAIGGLLYGFAGINAAYGTAVFFTLLGLVFYFFMKGRPVPEHEKEETLTDSLRAGLRFVFSHQVIIGAMALDMLAVLFGGAVAMLPVFASDILHTGPEGLGLLRAAPAFGAIIMAIFLAFKPVMKSAGRVLLFAVSAFGLCIIFFSLSEIFWLSLTLLIISGMVDNISVIIRNTIMQLFTPDRMRGRVAAINSIFVGSSNEIGAFESGLAARLMGLIPSVIFGGSITILIAGITAAVAPKLRKLNLNELIK